MTTDIRQAARWGIIAGAAPGSRCCLTGLMLAAFGLPPDSLVRGDCSGAVGGSARKAPAMSA